MGKALMPEDPSSRPEFFGMRSLVILAGLSLFFVALLVLAAKPLPNVSVALPSAPISGNIPYFLLMRLLQKLWGHGTGVLLAANGALMLMVGWMVYRTGWGLADDRHRLQGASLAMILFIVNPLALILPMTLGFLGGHILVPLFLLLFVSAMGMVEHWSAFMRAILLALTWSLLLWVHLPTALVVLVAMIPWVLYSRRPVPSLGIFMTVLLLGTTVFAAVWATGCAISGRWAMVSGPIEVLKDLWLQIHVGCAYAVGGGIRALGQRLTHAAGWLSPFLLIQGLWVTAVSIQRMLQQRRSSTADLEGLIALAVLLIVLFTPGKETLPGAWFLLPLLVLWVPLVAQELALKETFFSRGFRLTLSVGFVASGIALGIFYSGHLVGQVLPGALSLIKLLGVVALAGVASYAVLKKHPLSLESRVQALLAGATLAYFLVMDVQLLR